MLFWIFTSVMAIAQPREDCERYLIPGQPDQIRQVKAFKQDIAPGHVSYSSAFGLTVWEEREFADWQEMQAFMQWNSVKSVQELVAHLAMGLRAPGVSQEAEERVHQQVQSASIPEEEAIQDWLWEGRILMRENLIRHLWLSGGGLNNRTVFWLSAFPELLPFVSVVRTWIQNLDDVTLEAGVPKLLARTTALNEEGEYISLEAEHHFRFPAKDVVREEGYLTLKYHLTKSANLDRVVRAKENLAELWTLFGEEEDPPSMQRTSDPRVFEIRATGTISPFRLLQFFFFVDTKE